MSLLSKIKTGVANSGSSKAKIVFVKADSKVRIRFLQEIEDGLEVKIHDHFDRGINALCQDHVDGECPYCSDEDLRHRQAYVWSVWDYDAKETKLFVGFANNFNPLPSFVAMYESYGTIMDRDYVIQRDGKGTNSRYSVIPMDKVRFKNSKAKPLIKSKAIDILDKAYPVNEEDAGEKKASKKGKGRTKDEDPEETEDDDIEENDYESMSPRELYMECIERGLTAKKKQKTKYYIDMLLEDDEKAEDGWDDEEEDEDDEDGDW